MLSIVNYNKLDGYVGQNYLVKEVQELDYNYLFMLETWGGKKKLGLLIERIPVSETETDRFYICQIGNSTYKMPASELNERVIKDRELFLIFISNQVKDYERKIMLDFPQTIKRIPEKFPKVEPKPKNIWTLIKKYLGLTGL